MIVVKLYGGLGNQLFQYAAAKRLAHKHNTVLKLDITPFIKYKLRAYSLHPFNIDEIFATKDEIRRMQPVTGIKGAINRILGRETEGRILSERHFHFDPGVLDAPDDIYMNGYWQSEKYFKDVEDIIRGEFVVKAPQTGRDREIASLIQDSESVSLHIRRADYISNSKTKDMHGVCQPDYYMRGIEYMSERVPQAHFFVFSDDIAWAKENLRLHFAVTYVDHNDASRNYEDLRLITLCKHHIIANSTFSWWGAWLCPYDYKIVLAPERWFADENINTNDVIPFKWIKR